MTCVAGVTIGRQHDETPYRTSFVYFRRNEIDESSIISLEEVDTICEIRDIRWLSYSSLRTVIETWIILVNEFQENVWEIDFEKRGMFFHVLFVQTFLVLSDVIL